MKIKLDFPSPWHALLLGAVSAVLLFSAAPVRGSRITVPLNDDWRFLRQDVPGAEESSFDDSSWEAIDLPHTWNAADGLDDHPGYYRGTGTYRKRFTVPDSYRNRRIFLKLESACQVSLVWLNGTFLGQYYSGYVGFSIDITAAVNSAGPDNLLTLKIDNSNSRDVPPWNPEDFKAYPRSVDFNIYGGINSDVYLVVTDNARIESVFPTTPAVSAGSATTRIATEVQSNYDAPVAVELTTELLAADDRVINVTTDTRTVGPSQTHTFVQTGSRMDRPHLWSPSDPYLYRVRSRLFVDGRQVDEIDTPFGMRSIEWKPLEGLYLNGKKLYLRGVSRHQEYPGRGNALSKAQHVKDMELIKGMGANYVRLAHYPQDSAVLEACDRLGLLVWEEIPVAISVGATPDFTANALHILREMIRRDRHHPSVVFWGLMNETTEGLPFSPGVTERDVVDLVVELNDLAHALDPGRLTLASGVTPAVAMHVDLDVPQFWKGWFDGELEDYGKALDERHRSGHSFMGGSYGASSQVGRHTENPQRMDFSETYQCRLHESYLNQGRQRASWYAGACAWTAFDFGSNREDRARNPLPYVNQKGLFDAYRNPKDVYYLYKSFWTESPLFVYVVSRTWTDRAGERDSESTVRVYSNCPTVELFWNGRSQGQAQKDHGLTWTVRFAAGVNELKAVGIDSKGTTAAVDQLEVNYRFR
jgi:beta-galactosidase